MFNTVIKSLNSMNINDLNDDCFKIIFSLFNLKEKLLLECVCIRWQQLILQLLSAQKVLKIGLKSSPRHYYNCNDVNYKIHQCPELRSNDDWINRENITNDDLCSVVTHCPNIQFLYLCDCSLNVSTLEWIVCQFKQIKCLSLIAIQGLASTDWERIWSALAQRRLTHFTLSDNHLADIEITSLIENCEDLQELHLAYYRHPLTHLFTNFNEKFSKLSLIECFRTNLDAMKALVYGKGSNIKELVVYKVPTYDENILCEFIGIKMNALKRFSYIFDSPVPHIQPIEYLVGLEHLSLLSHDEYGINLSTLITKTLPKVKCLELNAHFDAYMLRNLNQIFPNVEILEFSFDRICCNCEPNNANQNQNNNNSNNTDNESVNQNNNPNANQNIPDNNNNNQNNNFVDDLDEDEPYVDDNCVQCSEKCVLIISKLDKLKALVMNGERVKDSAIRGLQFCDNLNYIAIDANCKELNLKLLLISCINLSQKNSKQIFTLKLSEKYFSRIININKLPKNFRIFCN